MMMKSILLAYIFLYLLQHSQHPTSLKQNEQLRIKALFLTHNVAINGCIYPTDLISKTNCWLDDNAIEETNIKRVDVGASDVDLPLRNRVTDWYLGLLCWWAHRAFSALTWISSTSCLSVSKEVQTRILYCI